MKQSIKSVSSPLSANLTIPASKSITNRALLLAALAEGVSEIFNLLISDDTLAMIHALHELGIALQLDEADRSCIVAGCGGQLPKAEATIYCREAGTVARFLLAACAGHPGIYHFDAAPQLRSRPFSALLNVLAAQGAKIKPSNTKKMPLTLAGTDGLHGGEVEIDAAQSGQFVSALLMIAPYAKNSLTIEAKNLVSQPYVEMTCEMMAEFGVLVRRIHQGRYSVLVPQRYKARDYYVEPDLSTAANFFAAAAVTGGSVTIQPFDREKTKQGDVAFLAVLQKMGCQIDEKSSGFTVQGPEQLRGVNVDMRDFSDTFMALAAIAPFADSPTTITNIGHARHQESNRITAMRTELEKLHVKVEEGKDWLKIYPSAPQAGVIDSHKDHRIAMAFAIVGLKVPGIIIEGADCVSKTCPQFFELWSGLHK